MKRKNVSKSGARVMSRVQGMSWQQKQNLLRSRPSKSIYAVASQLGSEIVTTAPDVTPPES